MIMAVRKIITLGEEGSEALRKICKPVDKFDDRLATLIDDMKETLAHADGLGLAAPQVGVLKRVVIVKYEEHEYELVNPRIIETSGESIDDEGCLSVKGQRGLVERPSYIKVEFLTDMATNMSFRLRITLRASSFMKSITLTAWYLPTLLSETATAR